MPQVSFFKTAVSLTIISFAAFACKQQRRQLVDMPDRDFQPSFRGLHEGSKVPSKNLSKGSRAARVAKSLKDAFRLYDDQKGFSLANSELEELCNRASEAIHSLSESEITELILTKLPKVEIMEKGLKKYETIQQEIAPSAEVVVPKAFEVALDELPLVNL